MLKRLVGNLPRWWNRRFGRAKGSAQLETARNLARGGDVAGALALCQATRSRFGASADLLAFEGGLRGMSGESDAARHLLEAALKLEPGHRQANADLGNIALAQASYDEARHLIDMALQITPNDPALLANRAQVERASCNWGAAERYYAAALESDPKSIAATDGLFSVYDESEQYQKAMDLADSRLNAEPDAGHWLHMRGFLLYKRLFDTAHADSVFNRAELAGEDSLAFWVDRGICARDLGDGERALAYLDRARSMEPDNPLPMFHRGLVLLYQQRYAEGWDAYEARLHDHHWLGAPLPAPRWSGENLNGTSLLVMAEQGLGDEIMFASCFDDLPGDATIHADCDQKLLPIFRASFPRINWVAKGGLPAIAAEHHNARAIPCGSLPKLYRRGITNFPCRPYLTAPPPARELARQKVAGLTGIKVGISWRGGTEITRKRIRSLPLAQVGKLASVPGVQWVNLQYGDCTEELALLSQEYGLNIIHWPEFMEPYEMTAALVQELDLVVSIDTTVAHLAGALGQETWILVPRVPEWRYGFSTRKMPWYAHAEILRQSSAGDWNVPMAEVMKRLREQAKSVVP